MARKNARNTEGEGTIERTAVLDFSEVSGADGLWSLALGGQVIRLANDALHRTAGEVEHKGSKQYEDRKK